MENLLTYFDYKTITKSKSYVKQVTRQNTQINVFAYKSTKDTSKETKGSTLGLLLQTQIKGNASRPYQVQVLFDANTHVLDTECSCPMTYDCKHTAAAVQGVYKNGLLYDAVSELYELIYEALYGEVNQDPATMHALSWIDEFQHTLSHISRLSSTSKLTNIPTNTNTNAGVSSKYDKFNFAFLLQGSDSDLSTAESPDEATTANNIKVVLYDFYKNGNLKRIFSWDDFYPNLLDKISTEMQSIIFNLVQFNYSLRSSQQPLFFYDYRRQTNSYLAQCIDLPLLKRLANSERLFWHNPVNNLNANSPLESDQLPPIITAADQISNKKIKDPLSGHLPLQWSAQKLQLDFEWQQTDDEYQLYAIWQPLTDKANRVEKSSHQKTEQTLTKIATGQPSHLQIVRFLPSLLCYVDLQQHRMGILQCHYPLHLLPTLMQTPLIPQAAYESFAKTLNQYIDIPLPRPEALKVHTHRGSDPIVVLRVEKMPAHIADNLIPRQIAIPVYFRYDGGDVMAQRQHYDYIIEQQNMIKPQKASESSNVHTDDEQPANTDWLFYFNGDYQNKQVRQLRCARQEQQLIQDLMQYLPESCEWLTEAPFVYNRQQLTAEDSNYIFISHDDLLTLMQDMTPLNNAGIVLEHTENSPLQVRQMSHPEVKIEDKSIFDQSHVVGESKRKSKTKQSYQDDDKASSTEQSKQSEKINDIEAGYDWFEGGVNVQVQVESETGEQYSFIDLLTEMVKLQPELLSSEYFENRSEETPLLLEHPTLGVLSFAQAEIQPIIELLRGLLSFDRGDDGLHLDRYDALRLVDLHHVLGMPWSGGDKLKKLHARIKQGFDSQLPTPKGFMGELRPYQQQGLAWLQFLREVDHAGILADDMGLGKTAQTLAHLQLEKNEGRFNKPTLIVAPTSVIHNWQQEIAKFTPKMSVLLLYGIERKQYFDDIAQYDIVLTTYSLLSYDKEELIKHHYYYVILDEAQHIKNPTTKMAQTARALTTCYRLCLTGTPIENNLIELWSLYHFLMPGFLGSRQSFTKTYRTPIEKHQNNAVRERLANRVYPFMLRRHKSDVAKDLPPKTTININVDMNKAQAQLYDAVRLGVKAKLADHIANKGFQRSQIEILDGLLKLRQVCCHPKLLKVADYQDRIDKADSAKLKALMDLLPDMVAEGRRVLLFSQFTSMLKIIETALMQVKISYVKLTGQTRKRQQVIEAFQNGEASVFLISLKAGGTGLNLTAADTVIHYDPWWNPAVENQASDRAWRIGQDKPVFVYKMIVSDSIEEKILTMQQEKHQLTRDILSHDQQDQHKFNEDDLLALLE